MTLSTRVGIISILSAIIAGSSAGAVYFLTPKSKTIKDEIEKSGRTLLNNDSKYWDIKLSTYKSEFENTIKLKSKDEKGLKEWCFNIIKSNFRSKRNNNFSNAKKLCTTPTYKEKLESKLKSLAGGDDWKNILKAYNKDAGNENTINGIKKGSINRKDLKKWCKKTLKQEISETKNTYITVEAWCAKRK